MFQISRIPRFWQIANLGMFVMAFPAPWFATFDGCLNGFQAGRIFWFLAYGNILDKGWHIFADVVNEPGYLWLYAVPPIVFVGIGCVGLYWIMSLARAFFVNQSRKWMKVLLIISLTGSVVGMSILTIFLSGGNGLGQRCFWGYWLVLGSLGSSILCEVVNARVAKKT